MLHEHAAGAALRVPGPGDDRLRERRRPDHRPVPRPQRRPGRGHRATATCTRHRAAARASARGQRHPAPAGAPGLLIGRGPRPTCASTTPASAAGTPSSGRAHRRRRHCRSRSSTSAPPTACGQRPAGRAAPPSPTAPGQDRQHHDDRRDRGAMTSMSELTLTLIKLGFLAVLWIFVLSARLGHPLRPVRRARSPRRARRRPQPSAAKPAAQAAARPGAARRPTSLIIEGATPASAPRSAAAPILLGRGADATIRLDDDYVSTRHARFAARRPLVRRGPRLHQRHLHRQPADHQPITVTLGIRSGVGKTIARAEEVSR